MSFLRQRKGKGPNPELINNDLNEDIEKERENKERKLREIERRRRKWSCIDGCCWFIGCICSTWWFLLFLYNTMPASFPQYVTEAITGPLPDPPGVKLRKEGLSAKHPVVFVPGIVTGGLELWEGHRCADDLFRKRLWGGTFGELYKRPLCWAEHMSLDNETGMDQSGVRVRPVSGLVAADYFAPGYFVWAVLIANLARIGYEEKTMYMAAYDWRLSFQNTEVRDQTLSRIKSNIELMVTTNGGKKVVVIPHSMGVLYFLHFMKWVEAPAPMGGGGGSDWCAKHIKAVMNIGGPFLGVPKAVSGLFSIEAKDIAVARAFAPGVLDKDVFGLQTLQHMMRMTRTWDATMSMIPKGGETIWGGLDRSPEGFYDCTAKKLKNNGTLANGQNVAINKGSTKGVNYGRMISFGKDIAAVHSSEIERVDYRGAEKGNNLVNTTTETQNPSPLLDRVAIVTGASRGIGRAIALHLASLGARIVVNYTSNSTQAEQVIAEINASSTSTAAAAALRAVAVRADVSDPDQVKSLFDSAEQFFNVQPHIMVNSAGVIDSTYPSISNTSIETFDRTFSVNARGTFLCLREAANRLKRGGGGRIISVTSHQMGALRPGFGAYAGSKAAVESMTQILAKELKGTGITANCVAPGPIATDMFYMGKTEEQIQKAAEENPLNRLGKPEDVAAVVGFLASDGSEWVNGQVIRANGGFV